MLSRPTFSERLLARRRGMMKWQLLIVFASLAGIVALAVSLLQGDRSTPAKPGGEKSQPLVLYCAASNKSVIEAIRADYEKQYKVPLQIQYGPSQTLLASIEVSKTGDLYLPADDSYLVMARERKLVADEF